MTGGGSRPLQGIKVLVVEDETMVSLLIEDVLMELGCNLVGSAGRLGTALELAETVAIDVAILDVNLAGEPVYPVAETLDRRGTPFVFTTGYGQEGVLSRWRDRPTVTKPFRPDELARTLAQLVGTAGRHGV